MRLTQIKQKPNLDQAKEHLRELLSQGYDKSLALAETYHKFPFLNYTISLEEEPQENKPIALACQQLEHDLPTWDDLSWDGIDNLMTQICKKHQCNKHELHDYFVAKHGQIPDEWVKNQ